MGETGCGKTRLIQFMCDMIALGVGGRIECVKNMLVMKVRVQLTHLVLYGGCNLPHPHRFMVVQQRRMW